MNILTSKLCPIPLIDDARLCQMLKSVLGLRFDLPTGRFRFRAPGQTEDSILADNQVLALISTTLAQQAKLFKPRQLRLHGLKRILGRLKFYCADASDEQAQILRHFVQERLHRVPGRDVTSAEIRSAYAAFIDKNGALGLSDYDFHRLLPQIIQEQFNLPKCHDITRSEADGTLKDRNGWHGLQLRAGTDTAAADGADGADSSLNNATDRDASKERPKV